MVWIAVVLALIGIGLAAYAVYASGRRDGLVSRSVAVHLKDDRTLRGILVAAYSDRVVLRNAAFVEGKQLRPLGGAQHVPMRNISFIQEILTVDQARFVERVDEANELKAVS